MSIVAAPAILLFLELLALLTINRSFCNGISDLGFFRSEKQDLLRFKQELKFPSNGLPRRNLKSAYEQPNLADVKQLPWKNLQYLDLRSNLFEGRIPIPPPDMKVFLVSNNKLTGEIPELICNMSTIEVLDLSNNSLTGTIPECLGHFSNSLRVLDLQKNQFHGNIPGVFGKDNDLRTLNMNSNSLKGPIPTSLLNCTKLEVLDLGSNNISGTFPDWLGKLPDLQVLVLHSNKFYGPVTEPKNNSYFSKLRIFDISNNNFTGLLPVKYFENMKSMMNVSGQVKKKPEYMGDRYYDDSVTLVVKKLEVKLVKILTIFCTIDFSNNHFHGTIPAVIGNFRALNHLNLSHNSLTGTIPPLLGNLGGLESLDLSSNNLSGRIPAQLTNLTFLAVLNLSQNQLEGPIPVGNQFDTFSDDSYSGNPGLCGLPLTKKCNSGEASQPFPEGDVDSNSDFGWKVVMMGYGCGTVVGLFVGSLVFLTRKPQWIVDIVEGKGHKGVRKLKSKHKIRRN
ncbi:receptor-like protein 49 [Mangifera indica]|uniref:receptor-like protein 49 n=1 Tax=Mangifera indica TaxID=29780 RepID=UPI001CFA4C04|nr:receptor-like protein 49 [Mangifera indica]